MQHFEQIKNAVFRLQPLPEEEWSLFAEGLQRRQFAKGEYLIREGQTEQFIYFLNSGMTRHYFLQDGKEFTVDFRFAGDFVTAYYSLITREPSAVFITAMEATDVWMIPYTMLQAFHSRSKNGERIGRLIAEQAYVNRLRREMELLSRTAEERYYALIAAHPEIVQLVSVKHLSSYLGIQPESLSRIRRRYNKS